MQQTNRPNVLPAGDNRQTGKKAMDMNIFVAKLVSDILKTTLGPKGMDKLLVDSLGDVTVTNDGATILRELTIEHPIAKMMVEIAKTQDTEIGDGTTTTVVLAGELLAQAEMLLKKRIHPTKIIKGYQVALDHCLDCFENMGVDLSKIDKPILLGIARTAMTGKGAESQRESLSDVVVDAVLSVREDDFVNRDNIKVESKTGGSVEDTKLVKGIILDRPKNHPNMPQKINNAKIALIDKPMELKNLDRDSRINITQADEMQKFQLGETQQIKDMVETIMNSDANVVFCTRGIDQKAIHFLSKAGIYAVSRVNREDIKQISNATGARIVTNLEELGKDDIGNAGSVKEEFIGESDMTIIEKCKNPKSCTILVRGSTEQATSEVKRAIEDAIGDIATVIKHKKVVGGAGAPEMILAEKIREYSKLYQGRVQLAIQAFAQALESIPESIAENAGLDPIDILTDIRSKIHDFDWPGIDIENGTVFDSYKEGIMEPLQIKVQAIQSAVEVATMVLRIDDVMQIMKNPDAPPSGDPMGQQG